MNCENCKVGFVFEIGDLKSGARYDREVSQTEEVISCTDSYCDPSTNFEAWLYFSDNQVFCPMYHSSTGQCCAKFETESCSWDSQVGRFSSSYYAEGAIVKDEFVFSSNRFMGYFVDVLY